MMTTDCVFGLLSASLKNLPWCSGTSIVRKYIDEVYAGTLKPGDDCLAVYPADRPHLGSLRVLHS